MVNDAGEIAAIFQGTLLDGCPVSEGPGGALRMTGIEPSQVLPAWRTARDALARTQRWPVFGMADFPSFPMIREPADIDAFDAAARSLDPWPEGRCWQDEPVDAEYFNYGLYDFAGFDLKTEARAQLTNPTIWSIDRWVYDRMLGEPELLAQGHDLASHLVGPAHWYEPAVVELLLLPTPQPHLAAAWAGFFEVEPAVLGAVLWQWHRRWGAELVASWGTMLQLVVSRRPALGEEAWTLARQQKSFASHQEADQWELALALARSDTWFMHRRP